MGSPQQPTYIIPPPSGPNWKTPLLIGVLVLLAAASIFQFIQLDKVRSETKADMVKLTQDVNSAIDRMKVDSNEEVQRSRRSVEDLQSRLAEQRRQAEASVGQAKDRCATASGAFAAEGSGGAGGSNKRRFRR